MATTILFTQEAGHTFEVDGASELIYGAVVCVSADNPASNLLGGFKESSSAHRPCRQCLTTREELQTMVCSCNYNAHLVFLVWLACEILFVLFSYTVPRKSVQTS